MLSNPSGYRLFPPCQGLHHYLVGIFLGLGVLSGALAQEADDGTRDPDRLYAAGELSPGP